MSNVVYQNEGSATAPAQVSLTDRLATFLRAHEGEWIDGRTLATIAGSYGWRTRVSNARRQHGLLIENRQRRVAKDHAPGKFFIVSEYRYVASSPRGPQ